MALTGILRTWHDDRGFGFIAPTQGGRELFVHISAFPNDGSRPVVGETLAYELGRGKDGKPQALGVVRQAIGRGTAPDAPARASREARRPEAPAAVPAAARRSVGAGLPPRARAPRRRSRFSAGVVVMLLVGVGAFAYTRMQPPAPAAHPSALPAVPVVPEAPSPAGSFRCDGRTRCTQMSSCAEARYFLANCPGVQMDGDGNGVPCEQQWCTGASGR